MNTSKYRPDIDGLRAIAITSVVAYHVGIPGFSGGFVGVDIFFVISGYLITGLLYNELLDTGGISIAHFYGRRIRRLLPALVVVIFAVVLLGFYTLPPFGEKESLFESAFAAIFFVANEFFRLNSGGYFDGPSSLIPLLHLWSLSVEEQFYIGWPLLLLLLAQWRKRFSAPSFALAATLLSAFSFALCLWLLARGSSDAAFFFTGARAWELGAGAVLALMRLPQKDFSPAWKELLSVAACSVIIAAIVTIDSETPFPGVAALLPVVATAVLIYAHSGISKPLVHSLLVSKPMVTVGRLSYSWYLWHWPLLAIARSQRLGEHDLWGDIGIALVSLVLSYVTYRLVEMPVRRGQFFSALPAKSVFGYGLLGLVGLSLFTASIWVWSTSTPRSPLEAESWRIANDRPPHQKACVFAASSWTGNLPLRECTIGGARPSIAVWGDSHADSWSPLLQFDGDSTSYVQLAMGACPPLVGLKPVVPIVKNLSNCRGFNDSVVRYFRGGESSSLKGVLISARWTAYAGKGNISRQDKWVGYYDEDSRSNKGSLEALERGLRNTLSALSEAGLRSLVVLSQPEFEYSIYRCLLVKAPSGCGIDRAVLEKHRRDTTQVIKNVVSLFDNARVVDPLDYYCNDSRCEIYVDGAPVSWDDDHVSATSARKFSKVISKDLCWLAASTSPSPGCRDMSSSPYARIE